VSMEELRDKFPKLSAEFPTDFRKFFNVDGTMNGHGKRAYELIKLKRRARMKKIEKKRAKKR